MLHLYIRHNETHQGILDGGVVPGVVERAKFTKYFKPEAAPTNEEKEGEEGEEGEEGGEEGEEGEGGEGDEGEEL